MISQLLTLLVVVVIVAVIIYVITLVLPTPDRRWHKIACAVGLIIILIAALRIFGVRLDL